MPSKEGDFMKSVKHSIAMVAAISVASLMLASDLVRARSPECVKDGKKFGVVEGNFREEWYSYQERADSYLEGECWEDALSDYERAIRLREGVDRAAELPGCDRRRARAYGMHFLDWFGHRGRGIALFELGRIDEAIAALEFSLKCTESSQAQFYLDKARAEKLRRDGGDIAAPVIKSVRLLRDEPVRSYVREGTPVPPPGYDRYLAVPYYFTLEDIEFIIENLSRAQKRDRQYVRSLVPGWGHLVISWKSADEIAGEFVKAGKLYLVVESEDDQGVQFVESEQVRSPYTFAQKTRADVFPIEISSPLLPAPDEEFSLDQLEPEDLFTLSIEETADRVKIRVAAIDLLGKRTEKTVSLRIDREGPRISIQEVKLSPAGDQAVIRGYIEDESGVQSFQFGGRTPKSLPDHRFEVAVPVGPDRRVKFEAADPLGNLTSGWLDLSDLKKGSRLETPVRWAGLSRSRLGLASREATGLHDLSPVSRPAPYSAWRYLPETGFAFPGAVFELAQNEVKWSEIENAPQAPPLIRLKTQTQAIYTNQVNIEGSALGQGGVLTSLRVNGRSVMRGHRSNAVFNRLLYLRPGKNLIKVEARDDNGLSSEQTITITRIVPRVNTVAERLVVSLLPFYIDPGFVDIGELAFDNMVTALVQQRRFRYVDRSQVNAAVREMRLSGRGLTDPNTAVRAGKITNAEAIIIGVVKETETSVELKTQVVDVESSRIMLTRDAFHQEKSLENIRFLAQGLAVKIKNSFPIVTGAISSSQGRTVIINLGSRQRLRPGMKVVLFKIIPKTNASGQPIGADTEKIGEGTIMAVTGSNSTIQVTSSSATPQAQDMVVTK